MSEHVLYTYNDAECTRVNLWSCLSPCLTAFCHCHPAFVSWQCHKWRLVGLQLLVWGRAVSLHWWGTTATKPHDSDMMSLLSYLWMRLFLPLEYLLMWLDVARVWQPGPGETLSPLWSLPLVTPHHHHGLCPHRPFFAPTPHLLCISRQPRTIGYAKIELCCDSAN